MLNGAPNRRERPSVKTSVLHSNTSYTLVLYNYTEKLHTVYLKLYKPKL